MDCTMSESVSDQREDFAAPGPGEPPESTGGAVSAAEESAAPAEEQHTVDEDFDDVQKALSETENELAAHREAMLRMQADMENLRKRLVRDLERSRKFALEGFMKDLLQVRDSLERGLEMAGASASAEPLREGKELTLKMLGKVMSDHGLEVIDPKGQPFDPDWHEAVTMQPSQEHPENTVLEVLQKGFKLHDRLIRPAMVVVSRKT